MRIISARQGFASDHSSTSYEFLAVDKPLSDEDRGDVASLSSRAAPTRRRVSFIYHAEGYDLPGGYEPLLERYYDVMYSESYDWWTLGFAFDAPPEQHEEIAQYDFCGCDDQGISVTSSEERVIIVIDCKLRPGSLPEADGYDRYNAYDSEDDDEEEWEEDEWDDDEDTEEVDDSEEGEDEQPAAAASPAAAPYDLSRCDDPLLVLLAEVRQQLIDGDYRSLYDVFRVYGWEPDAEGEADGEDAYPPEPEGEGEEAFGELYHMLC